MNISDAFRNVRIDTEELRKAMKALNEYARTRRINPNTSNANHAQDN